MADTDKIDIQRVNLEISNLETPPTIKFGARPYNKNPEIKEPVATDAFEVANDSTVTAN